MKHVIRTIRREDNAVIEKIIRACLIEYGGDHEGTAWADPDLGKFSEVYDRDGRIYFVCEDESGRVVGGAGIGEINGADGVCELQKMYCIPEVRGTGVGEALIFAALGFAKDRYRQCYLETLPNMVRAQKFYEKNGFERTEKVLCGGEHFACDVRYIKTLTSHPHNSQGGTVMNKEYSPLTRPQSFEERKAQVRYFLGRTVDIEMDRPIGTVHPKHDNIIYPINYGYIPGVPGGDGEELDVYLLGVSEPVGEYTCRIIAVAHRMNDVEDKLVGAPDGMEFSAEEIAEAISFQEKYYKTKIETE